VLTRRVSRSQFLIGSVGALASMRFAGRAAAALPRPSRAGIDHIVVLTMENRSFDHLLGWLPGADGKQAGLSYRDRNGAAHSTHRLAPDFQGCGHPDPEHTYAGLRVSYDGGRCDGFLRAGQNDVYAIGYYTRRDLPFLGAAAPAWTVCDRYFGSIMAPTLPNRMYLHAGRTDRTNDLPLPSFLPTIWDLLAEHGVPGRFYRSTISYLGLWGLKYLDITRSFADFLHDCRTGDLPAVAYVDPDYAPSRLGVGNSDHPHVDIRVGEWLMWQVYNAVTTGPAWSRTLLVITFDESGGFFDHVPPTLAPDVDPDHSLRGFRVPTLLVSPFARRGYVDHRVYDHTSILKLIEWRFGLPPLSVRDAHANNLAAALDLSRRNLHAPAFRVPRAVLSLPCPH
jgi:phospholipase C